MDLDKELTIQFMKEDNPELYQKLKKSGELERLSHGELVHLHALSATECEDVSDISDDDIDPVNTDMIDDIVTRVQQKQKKKARLHFIINKVALATSFLVCFGVILTYSLFAPYEKDSFIDTTSQETTDYAIRVHCSEGSSGLFHSEFISELKRIVHNNAAKLPGSLRCRVLPVSGNGQAVVIKLAVNNRSEYAEISLKDKNKVISQLEAVIPNMMKKLAR